MLLSSLSQISKSNISKYLLQSNILVFVNFDLNISMYSIWNKWWWNAGGGGDFGVERWWRVCVVYVYPVAISICGIDISQMDALFAWVWDVRCWHMLLHCYKRTDDSDVPCERPNTQQRKTRKKIFVWQWGFLYEKTDTVCSCFMFYFYYFSNCCCCFFASAEIFGVRNNMCNI